MIYSEQEIEAANSRASALLARTPTAVAAHYDQRLNRVFIDLSSGVSIAFKAGSSSKSIAKTAAVRANGKLGGLLKRSVQIVWKLKVSSQVMRERWLFEPVAAKLFQPSYF